MYSRGACTNRGRRSGDDRGRDHDRGAWDGGRGRRSDCGATARWERRRERWRAALVVAGHGWWWSARGGCGTAIWCTSPAGDAAHPLAGAGWAVTGVRASMVGPRGDQTHCLLSSGCHYAPSCRLWLRCRFGGDLPRLPGRLFDLPTDRPGRPHRRAQRDLDRAVARMGVAAEPAAVVSLRLARAGAAEDRLAATPSGHGGGAAGGGRSTRRGQPCRLRRTSPSFAHVPERRPARATARPAVDLEPVKRDPTSGWSVADRERRRPAGHHRRPALRSCGI